MSETMVPARRSLLQGPLDTLTLDEAVSVVDRHVSSRQPSQHGCLNAAKVVRLQSDAGLRDALWSCDLVTADGQAVVWAARALGVRVPARVAGIDLMERLLSHAAERGYRVYLLGARQEVLERAEAEIRRRHPALVIAGSRNGYFSREEEPELVAQIAATRPDLLFIALDTPSKELFLARHRGTLDVPFAMGVGGSLDVLAGDLRRAPGWAQRAGLEWAFRLAQEPRRLAKRYVVGNSRFLALVLRELALGGRARARRSAAPAQLLTAPRPTVLFVGPSPTARGGVASVIAALAATPSTAFQIETLATFRGGGRARKLLTLGGGLVRGARRIPARDVALVHLHASAWASFRRKLLFYGIARAAGKPVVWHIHCSRFGAYLDEAAPVERRLVRSALRQAAAVICVSADVGERIRVATGVEPVQLAHPVPAVAHSASAEPVVVALGDITERKGTFALLRAFAQVVAAVPDARLVLAGVGATAEAATLAAELGIAGSVELPGWVDSAGRERLLARAQLLAHPTFADALPMAVLEALAAGRPVVASRVGGIPDVVTDGENGLLVEPGDVDGLAASLTRLLADHGLRARMESGAADAARAFEPAAVLARLGQLYDQAWRRAPADA